MSSVDTGADTLTSTGVAAAGGAEGAVLITGDRMRLRNTGGALPAATPSLAGATDYFARRVSDDAIQIYDTNAHAVAGGGTGLVNLTGSGSGTTTIEFGLPYCLPTAIAGAGVQARSSIFNAMYNALVALYCLLTGQAQSVWSSVKLGVPLTYPRTLQLPLTGPGVPSNAEVSITSAGYQIQIPAIVGFTIVGARAKVLDSATGPTKLQLQLGANDPSVNNLVIPFATSSVSSGAGVTQTLPLTSLTQLIVAGNTYYASVIYNTGTAACKIKGIEIDLA